MNPPDHIQTGLHNLEIAFSSSNPERLELFAQVLRRKQISPREMAEAVTGCIENHKSAKFPTVAEILQHARPSAQGMPRRDEDPVFTMSRSTRLEDCRARRAALIRTLDVYEDQRRPQYTIAAVSRDIQALDREIGDREQLANETRGMTQEDADAYAIRFWGGEHLLPNVLAALAAGPEERRLRGPEMWDGTL